MPRPKSKDELLKLSQENFKKLIDLVASLSSQQEEAEFREGTMNRNIRDVLAHLHHWHLMMLDWYKVGMSEQKPDMPAKGYTWKTVPELNRKIWEDYQNTDLLKVSQLLRQSFADIQKIIRKHTNEELFEKKKYKWTGTTSLGAYLVSATSSHYDWALKLIKKGMQ